MADGPFDQSVDDYVLTVKLVPDTDQPPSEVWSVTLLSEPDAVPFDTMEELVAALKVDGYPPPYTINATRSYVSWGASGAVEQILLTVAEWVLEGTVAGTAYHALYSTVRSLARRAREKPRPGFEVDPLTREVALARARAHLTAAFNVEENDLRLMHEDSVGDDQWLFQFEHPEGQHLEVEVADQFGLVLIARKRWTTP